jgi:hypothetical protein
MLFTLLAFIISFPLFAAPCLKDVKASLTSLTKVIPIDLHENGVFEGETYKNTLRNWFGYDSHIQGIIKAPGSSVFFLSGAEKRSNKSSLFIARLTSKEEGIFLSRIDLDTTGLWHAGAMGHYENILAVPVGEKSSGASKILFYDLRSPAAPQQIPFEILRPQEVTGSVFFFPHSGTPYIATNKRGEISFYKYGPSAPIFTLKTELKGEAQDLVRQCDGKLFVLDFRNESPVAPVIKGDDYIDLYQFDFLQRKFDFVGKKIIATRGYCNFKAAASASVSDNGQLTLYGSSFYRQNGKVRICLIQ